MNPDRPTNHVTKRRAWRFWIPLTIQAALIVAVPLQSAVIYNTGTAVTLKTAPVDPYDLLRGYSQTLRYEISDLETLSKISGGKEIFEDRLKLRDQKIYVTLKSPDTPLESASAWEPVQVSLKRPTDLPDNQVVLAGVYSGWNVKYGLETYYMPEKQRDRINKEIRDVQNDDEQSFLVDIKVNEKGKSVPVSLWVGDRKYKF